MAQSKAFVSVVMPVRNEGQFIEGSLDALLSQDIGPNRMEVIVVDGMSDDQTRAIVQHAAVKDERVVLIDNFRRITPCAMNLGIKRARGDVIFRIDGHAVVPADYVSKCLEWLDKEDVEGVGGAMDSEGTSYVGEAIAVGMSSPFGVGGCGFRTGGHKGVPVPVDTLPFWAFKRSVFDRVGLFNEEMVRHQDYEFNYRFRRSGGRLLLLPWLHVKYYVRSTLSKFWRQYWQYGIWKGRFLRTYPTSARLRHLVPPMFVLSLLSTLVLAVIAPAVGLRCLALMAAAYCVFLSIATLSLAVKGHLRQAPLIPLILLSLHLVWGCGVWIGLLSGKVSKTD